MPTLRNGLVHERTETESAAAEAPVERWIPWSVNWSAVWVGALSAAAAVVLLGLIGLAVGAHLLGPEHRVVDLKKIGIGALAFSIFTAFLAFVIGGWVAGKVGGFLRSEPAMLHGAIVWLITIPALTMLAGIGAGSALGAWHGGMVTTSNSNEAPFERPEALGAGATEAERQQYRDQMAEYRSKVEQWKKDTPKATRNAALGTVTALLLGLMGSVVGGWMASGEPMTFTHYRTRTNMP